jgi:hypothetical protein
MSALETSSLRSFTGNSLGKAILIVLAKPGIFAINSNASIENGASVGGRQKKCKRRSPVRDR